MDPKASEGQDFHYWAFGLAVRVPFALPGMRPGSPASSALRLTAAEPGDIAACWSGREGPPVWETRIDGRAYAMERGRGGDHLMRWGPDALFHLSDDCRRLRCTPPRSDRRAWERFMLDTVLWSASLLAGFEQLHASAVLGDAGAVGLMAGSGGGKSTLAAELVRRGLPLFCDDILALRMEGSRLGAHPGPALMNLPAGESAARAVGETVAVLGHERWVTVRRATNTPSRVAALCLLDRRPGAKLQIETRAATVLDLLPHSLGFPHQSDRLRSRFELFARLAAEVPVYRLTADPSVPPPELADLVEPLAHRAAPSAASAG